MKRRIRSIRPPPPNCTIPRRHHRCHQHRHAHSTARSRSAYAFGSQWTGSLSRPSIETEEATELTNSELLEGELQNLVTMEFDGDDDLECVAAAAGWGHSALLVRDQTDDATATAGSTRLLVSGRPQDFQTLMRLRRLPPSVRNFCIERTSNADEAASGPSAMQRLASFLAGENEVTFHEEECRRYSNIKTMMEIPLPDDEAMAVEGQSVDENVLSKHGRRRWMPNEPIHTTASASAYNDAFQNTLAASAGLTAAISQLGTLYMFGLNHRGQCGVGKFTPNVWTPQRVVGLASLRFMLDYNSHGDRDGPGNKSGSDVYKECEVQEYPVVGVALGLQHGNEVSWVRGGG
jgi:hypothetical protein